MGCNLSVKHFQGSWWGEGDDMFFIDGEEFPSIIGTGTEDYFNHAWGMQQGNHSLYHGSILHERDLPEAYQVAYRFHIEDPVHFQKKHQGHDGTRPCEPSLRRLEHDAYWYQKLPTKPFGIQGVEERIPLKLGETAVQKISPEITQDISNARESLEERKRTFSRTADGP